MMAPEATAEQPVDASVPDLALTQATEHDSQNVDDIENKQIAEIVDELVNSAEVSVSGGSDTEASKAKSGDDEKGHGRTSSTIKKPQSFKSFKSVSVNKTFLAAKGAATIARPESTGPATATTPTTSGSSASKLKLVAKSNNTLGGSTKTLASNGKPPSAPDPNTVWNKNRPVPVPEPKKMTDEELRKYGIHMADRLRPEDDRGQSNWADIDDDEEWAPETITWTDGTKITLPQVDEPPPTPSQMPAIPAKEVTIAKPKSPVPSVPADTDAKASPTIKTGVLTAGKGLVLKGASEKPTLVAKAPALPTPAKSPWAPLPPVDRASPVVMEIPVHQQQSGPRGYPPRDMAHSKSMTPPPAKEIAADDFSRSSWREGQAGNRELFNSQSGRYEPVHDRRGSRHDPRGQPALLQRPHQQDQQGPAEPSAAFQTSRTTGQDAMPYGRRRGSSNVSGGSGSLTGRLGKPLEVPSPAEVYQPGIMASPTSATFSPVATHQTPHTHHAQPLQTRPSPGQSHAIPLHNQTDGVPAPPQISMADDLELQKKLMRERREMAIKRRMEEEAREEAERKERIRLKLEAMGPAPERKSTRKDDIKDVPTQIQQRDGIPAALLPKADFSPENHTSVADSVKHSAAKPDSNSKTETPPVNDARHNFNQADRHHAGQTQPGPAAGTQTTAPWPDSHRTTERMSSWSSGSQTATRNVWAAPGNDRTLGNGTFNADLANLADSQPVQPSSLTTRPAPIGPPRAGSQGQQRPDPTHGRLPPIGPPNRNTQAPGQRTGSRNPWSNADIAADDRAIRTEKQKRAEEQVKGLSGQGISLDDVQAPVRDTWRSVNLSEEGKRTKAAITTRTNGDPNDVAAGPSWNPPAVNNEPPEVDRHDVAATICQEPISQDYRQHPRSNGMRNDFGRQPPIGPAGTSAPGPVPHPRGASRFFPSGSRDVRLDDVLVQPRSTSPTPPPPTMDDHPAYDGDANKPHVLLPRSKPVVKLPPAAVRLPPAPVAPIAPPKPVSFAAAVAAARPPSRGNATQETWQERINSLIGRKGVSPGKPMTVDSSSKSALDYTHAQIFATVSLPSLSSAGSTTSEDSSYTSREMAEECFGEQEMGSLPQVRLPSQAPDALWHACEPIWSPILARWRVTPTSAEPPIFQYDHLNSKGVIRIHMEGMNETKTILAPFTRNKSNPRRQDRGGRRNVSSRGGARGGREPSSNFLGEQSSTPSDRLDRPSARGRGSYRGRSENWSRVHAPAAQAA